MRNQGIRRNRIVGRLDIRIAGRADSRSVPGHDRTFLVCIADSGRSSVSAAMWHKDIAVARGTIVGVGTRCCMLPPRRSADYKNGIGEGRRRAASTANTACLDNLVGVSYSPSRHDSSPRYDSGVQPCPKNFGLGSSAVASRNSVSFRHMRRLAAAGKWTDNGCDPTCIVD
jgi:hypothetical protein